MKKVYKKFKIWAKRIVSIMKTNKKVEKVRKMKIDIKKTFVLTAMLLVASVTFFGTAAAQTSAVILVSDNEADSTMAKLIGSSASIEVVSTPWGDFDQSVVDKIKALNPAKIYIIGGEVAVVGEYDTALNFTSVERIAGETREKTAANAIKHFKDALKGKRVILVYGYDGEGIRKAFEKAKREKSVVAFIKLDEIPDELEDAINATNATEVELDESPNTEKVKIEKEGKKLRGFRLHSLNETEKAEKALEQINEAREEIAKAEAKIAEMNVTNKTAIIVLLNNAKEHLAKAEAAYNESKYGEAFGQAVSAEHLAENAKELAEKVSEFRERSAEKITEKIKDLEEDIADLEEDAAEEIAEAARENRTINTTLAVEHLELAKAALQDARGKLAQGDIAGAVLSLEEAKKHKALAKIAFKRARSEGKKKFRIDITLGQEKDGKEEIEEENKTEEKD